MKKKKTNHQLRKIKRILDKLSDYNINFTRHFFDKAYQQRGIDTSLIVEFLNKPEKLAKVDIQRDKYKLWFKKSSKYSVVILISLKGKYINIITSYITSKKWQKRVKITPKR